MRLLIVLPILIPFFTAITSLLFWRWRMTQRVINVMGASALLLSAICLLARIWTGGIAAIQMGDWPAPFGITLVADLFASIMVMMAGLVGLAVSVYSLMSMDKERESFGYYPLLHVLLMGVCGSFLTGDLFNLYVWFEVMLISSFVLMELGGEKAQLEGAIKYVTLNLMSSALFLTAVGILYGIAGTLNMADLAVQLKSAPASASVTTVALLFFLAFGIKAAVFPLFFWLPASYHTPPVSVSAVFAGLLTKVGVYALIRVFTLIFTQDVATTHTIILIVGGITMVTGVLGAVAQYEFRRLLSFHIVSQIGYMIVGLGFYVPLGLAGSIFHMVHNMLAKTNLFFISGAVFMKRGTYDLKKLGGFYQSAPRLAVLFLISAFGLAGMPPLSGFWSKLILVKAGLDTGNYVIVAAALGVSLLTTYSMTKLWNEVFWKNAPAADDQEVSMEVQSENAGSRLSLYLPIVVFALLVALIGLLIQPMLVLILAAADQLMDPAGYIRAVLGVAP